MKKGEKEKHPIELKKRGEDRRRKERREGKKRKEEGRKKQKGPTRHNNSPTGLGKKREEKEGGGTIGCQSYTSNLPLTHPLGTHPSPRQS